MEPSTNSASTQDWIEATKDITISAFIEPYTLRGLDPSRTSGFRLQELKWRREHKEALQHYVGSWVALEGTEIIAHGSNPQEVDARAKARGIQAPYIFYVEPPAEEI